MASSSQKSDQIVIQDFGDDPNNSPEFWVCEDSNESFQSAFSKIVDNAIDRLSNCDENSSPARNNNLEQFFRSIDTLKPGTFYKRQDTNLQVSDDIFTYIPNHEETSQKQISKAGTSKKPAGDYNDDDFIVSTKITPTVSTNRKTSTQCYNNFNDILISSQENNPRNYLKRKSDNKTKSKILGDENVQSSDTKSKKKFGNSQKIDGSLKSFQNPKMQVMNESGSKRHKGWIDNNNNDFTIFTKKVPPVSAKRKATSQEKYFQSGDISNNILTSSREINSQNCLEQETDNKYKKRKNNMLGNKNIPKNDNKSKRKAGKSHKSNKCTKENSEKKKDLGLSETSKLIKKPSTSSNNSKSTPPTFSKIIDNLVKEANIQRTKLIKEILPRKKSNVSTAKETETIVTSDLTKEPNKNNNGFMYQMNFENWLKNEDSEMLREQRNRTNFKTNSSTSETQIDEFLNDNSNIISQEKVSSFIGNITLPNLINTSNINKISSFKNLKIKDDKLDVIKHSQKSVENLTKKKNSQTSKSRKESCTNLSRKSLDLGTPSRSNEKVLSWTQKNEQEIDSLRKEVLKQSDSKLMRKNEIPKSSKSEIMNENVEESSHFKVPMPPIKSLYQKTKKNSTSSLIKEGKESTSRKNVSSSNIDLENSIFHTSTTDQKNFSKTSTTSKENFLKNNSSKKKRILEDDLFQEEKPLRSFKRAKTKLSSKLNFDPREALNDYLETRSISSFSCGSSIISQNSGRSTFSRNPSNQSISSNASQNFTLPGPQYFEHLSLKSGSQRSLRSRRNSTSSIASSLYSVRTLRSRTIQSYKTPNDQASMSSYNLSENEEESIRDISEYMSNLSQTYNFHEASVELALAFVNPETFIVSSNEDMILTENSVGIEEFISSQNDLPEDRILEVVIQGDYQIDDDSEKLEKKLEKNRKDDSLIYKGDPVKIRSYERKKEIVLMKIRNIFRELGRDVSNNSKLQLMHKVIEWSKCSLKDNRVIIEPKQIKYTTICFGRKNSQNKFKILIYLLKKVYNLLMMNATSTKREIYYQIINYARSQPQVDASINALSSILECPPWDLGILPTSKGLIYGPLKIFDTDGNVQEFYSEGGTLIPQDFNKFDKIESSAYFILVVEKDCIFQKLLSENVHEKICRPFLLVTGKGYADLNTRRFLHLLWKALSIPIFIFTDADPYGIEIMLTYRFGAQNTALMSDELILPSAKWLGVLPSEFNMLNIECQKLTTSDVRKLELLLKRQYVKENLDITQQLKIMLERNLKAEIEGVIKHHFCLSSSYIPNKLCYKNYI